MKQIYAISALSIALLIFATPFKTMAQPVTATWSLTTDQSVEISGAGAANVTANPQSIGSAFVGVSYGYSTGTPPQTGWQRIGVNTGSPVVQGNYPIAFDTTNGYVQYSIAPVSGHSFTLSSISFEALGNGSGGSRMAVFYSLNGFAAVDSFSATYNVGGTTPYSNYATPTTPIPLNGTGSGTMFTGQQIATLIPRTSVTITANSGQTLSVRLYYFNATLPTASSKPLANRNMVINGITNSPLPLKLVDFTSRLEGGNTKLLWNTQNQVNVKLFEVEKSINGKNFSASGLVNASVSGSSGSYSFTDEHTANGANYYRLKMIDKDGSYTYSHVVVINTKLANMLSVFPNPAVGSITITHAAARTKSQLFIHNSAGQIVKTINLSQGATQTNVSVEDLSKGSYFISDNGRQLIKFSKL